MEYPIYEVSQINTYLKDKFDSDPFLGGLCVRGELSNYKVYPSGHHYFTMKDAEGALRCVMFRGSAMRLRFRPENGMKVLAVGRITVYPRDGAYQMYCEALTPDGVGDLHVAYEQLKEKLQEEDLWAFNDERVARAIYESEIPVVSAVGHEPDVTISDFVADVRAATPSNGAELIAPDQMELKQHLRGYEGRMAAAMERKLKLSRQQLEALAGRRVLQSPRNYFEDRRVTLDRMQERLGAAAQRIVDGKRRKFEQLTAALDAMSPLKVLGRGYAMVKSGGKLAKSIRDLAAGDTVCIRLRDGAAEACVTGIQEETNHV